jgi:hypothetical protein
MVTAADLRFSSSLSFRLIVNFDPVYNAFTPPVIRFTHPVSFHLPEGVFTDDNRDTLTYSATFTGGTWLAFAPTTHLFFGTPAIGDLDVVVKLCATDG